MWGNLGVASEEKREVGVPLLQPGQVGVVSVTLAAPVMEGTYTSHWRLVHCGGQFGPRVWCSIVVDPSTSRNSYAPQSKRLKEDLRPAEKEEEIPPLGSRDSGTGPSVHGPMDFYFPSVDLLTAQDLLSFELLDINIVQELEKVPTNTPVDLTPCISPLPHDGPPLERAGPAPTAADAQVQGVQHLFGVKPSPQRELPDAAAHEEGAGEDLSGAQFLCETIIRSLALEEAPDHQPPRRAPPSGRKHTGQPRLAPNQGTCQLLQQTFPAIAPGPGFGFMRRVVEPQAEGVTEADFQVGVTRAQSPTQGPPGRDLQDQTVPEVHLVSEIEHVHKDLGALQEERGETEDERAEREEERRDGEEEAEDWDEVSSQGSSSGSSSSCEDYVIVLPDCFDTSRPLGESMYSSALSQAGAAAGATAPGEEPDSEAAEAVPEGEWQEEESVVVAAVAPPAIDSSVNQMLCASRHLDATPLTPEVVLPPVSLLPPAVLYSPRSEELYVAGPSPPVSGPEQPCQPAAHLHTETICQPAVHLHISGPTRPAGSVSAFQTYNPRADNSLIPRGQGGITEGLVKGALSVAASAYKALFTGPSCSTQRGIDPARQDPSMMAVLLEMGFRDQRLNQRLLRKHRYDLLHTVNALVQLAEAEEARTDTATAATEY